MPSQPNMYRLEGQPGSEMVRFDTEPRVPLSPLFHVATLSSKISLERQQVHVREEIPVQHTIMWLTHSNSLQRGVLSGSGIPIISAPIRFLLLRSHFLTPTRLTKAYIQHQAHHYILFKQLSTKAILSTTFKLCPKWVPAVIANAAAAKPVVTAASAALAE